MTRQNQQHLDAQAAGRAAQRQRENFGPQDHRCECGCGGRPRGVKSRFVPGHDAKLHSATRPPKPPVTCGCGCQGQTKGGRFLPGHDARFYSALKAAAKAA